MFDITLEARSVSYCQIDGGACSRQYIRYWYLVSELTREVTTIHFEQNQFNLTNTQVLQLNRGKQSNEIKTSLATSRNTPANSPTKNHH